MTVTADGSGIPSVNRLRVANVFQDLSCAGSYGECFCPAFKRSNHQYFFSGRGYYLERDSRTELPFMYFQNIVRDKFDKKPSTLRHPDKVLRVTPSGS